MSAPEIIFGGQASVSSSVYTASIVCCHILAGRSPVKTGESEQKHVQYIYRTLGTPKKEGYKNFQNLPLAGTYGRHIIQEGKEPGDSRSRIAKVLREILPSHVLEELSGQANSSSEEGDKGMVLDVLRKSTQLAPHRRTSPLGVLSMPLFTKNAGKLGVSERKAGFIALRAKLK
jgi:serine/threonine protein kinase